MKRSLFIAIVVLLMAALFVSCNADKALQDQLVEVSIDGGAKAISATGVSNVPGVESLYWYYKAEKNDNGRFTTGATPWTAIEGPGLAGASLGSFSSGYWKFSFYGFTASGKAATDVSEAVYKCEGMIASVRGAATALTVKLELASTPGAGQVTFGAITIDGTAEYKVVVSEGTAAVAESAYVEAVSGTATMTPALDNTTPYQFANGSHTLTFKVYEKITNNTSNPGPDDYYEQIISESDVTFMLTDGVTITISGDAEASEVTYLVNVDGTVTQASAVVNVSANTATTVQANVTPAEYGASSVAFPAGSLAEGTYALDMEVSGAAGNFTVSDTVNGVAVAGISLSLTKENDTTFNTESFGQGQKVTVTTYVAKGLTSPKVYYGSEPIEVVDYEPSTGKLVFATPHFSDFVVVVENIEAINLTQNKAYASLSEAVENKPGMNYDWDDTVLVLKDCELESTRDLAYFLMYDIKLDLGGHTVTVKDFIYAYSDVTICNGSLEYTTAPTTGYAAVQVYTNGSNNTLKDVNITSYTADNKMAYALYVMGGASIVIDGGVFDGSVGTNGQNRNSSITINGGVFKDGCYFPAHGTYIINDGTFEDLVEIKSGTLTINGGSFNCGTAGEAQYIAYENGNAIHNAALGAVAYNGNIEPDNNYGPTPTVIINGGSFNGSICVARKTADIAYPTVTIDSSLNLSVVELGVIPASN